MLEFPHSPPTKDYSYEYENFNTRTICIWLCNTRKFDYNLGARTKTVWGFYNPKTIGKEVNIENTTPYTAMQVKRTSLEECFV